MAKKAAAKAKKTTAKKSTKPVHAAKKLPKAKPARPSKPAKAVAKKPTKALKAKGKAKPAPSAKPKASKKKAAVGKKPAAKPAKATLPKPKANVAPVVKKVLPPMVKKDLKQPPTSPAPKAQAPRAAQVTTTVVPVAKPVDTPAPPRPVVVKKKPLKERYSIEFLVHSTPSALYEMLLSPSGFSEWYCDDVDVRGEEYTFKWGNEEEVAMIIGQRQNEVTRFHRVDDDDPDSYFEFRIKIDPITDEVALIVTDHAWPHELENSKALWASQIANLTRVLGA
jgi:START-like superfamily domain